MTNISTTEVTLLGQRLVLKPSESDPEVIRQVIQLVTHKLDKVEARCKGTTTPQSIALLALLDLAEEYINAKKRTQEFKDRLDEKSKKLLELVEAANP